MKRSGGFTLIELMVVVGIMILVASIVVTGSFGMSRASSYLAAENVVYNTLQAARQKACTDGKRVLVAFIAKGDERNGEFALVSAEAAGTVASVNEKYIRDRSAVLAQFAGTRSDDSIWNLKTGDFVEGPFTNILSEASNNPIPPDDDTDSAAPRFGYTLTQLQLIPKKDGGSLEGRKFAKNMWHEGDAYGFQVGEMQEMPRGFKLGVGSVSGSPKDRLVVFEPDGSSFLGRVAAGGLSGSSRAEIYVYEEIAKDNALKIVVDNGTVKVDKRK